MKRKTVLERSSHPVVGLTGLFFFLAGQVVLPMAATAQTARQTEPERPAPAWVAERDRREATASQTGKIKPSEETGCTDCEVTMHALNLKRVPTEKELRMAGQLGGALNPIGNADVLKLEAVLNTEMLEAGVAPSAAAKAPSTSAAGKLHRIKTKKIERLKQINLTFGVAIQEWNKHNYRQAARLFEQHMEAFPDSPWNGEALLHLGCDDKYNGRFSQAEDKFDYLLRNTDGAKGSDSYEIHQKAKLRWADLDIGLGRLDDATPKLRDIIDSDSDWRRRTWARHWLLNLSRSKKHKTQLAACGSQALAHILTKLDKADVATAVARLHPPREAGYSLAELQRIGQKNGLRLTGFKAANANQLEKLPLPLIVHYDFEGLAPGNIQDKQKSKKPGLSNLHGYPVSFQTTPAPKLKGHKTKANSAYRIHRDSPDHYLVIQSIDHAQKTVQVYDPLAKRLYYLAYAELEQNWSGKGLVLGTSPLRVASLTLGEMAATFGGCCGIPSPEQLGPCEGQDGNGSCSDGPASGGIPFGGSLFSSEPVFAGAPVWSVSRINTNLHVADTPMWYETPVGPDVEITFNYNSQDALSQASPAGNKWVFNYRMYLVEDTALNGGVVTVFMPYGDKENYAPNGSGGYTAQSAGNHTVLTKLSSTRYQLQFQQGDIALFDIPSGSASLQPFLVELKDRWGYSLTFDYEDSGIYTNLTKITDAQGKETHLEYDANGHLARAIDPFERVATFVYDVNGNMVECIDMEGNAFQYTYDADIRITQLNTAQGPWQFYHEGPDGNSSVGFYPASGAPMWDNLRLTVTDPAGQKEEFFYDGLNAVSWHVAKEHYREYNQSPNNGSAATPKTEWHFYGNTIADGRSKIGGTFLPGNSSGGGGTPMASTGQSYDYYSGLPTSLTNEQGNTSHITYNAQGQPTSITDPKSQTTTITYAGNGLDVASVTNAQSVTVASYQYDAYHQPTSITDAQSNTTTLTYTAWGAPLSVTDAEGKITNYLYDGTSKQLLGITTQEDVLATPITLAAFTYDAVGRVRTHTDAAGLTLTYDYNNLDKVTKVTYPDSTTIETEYVCCGMPGVVKDRSGRKSYYDYDAMKRLTRMQDAAGNSVQIEYDGNGNRIRLVDGKGNATRWQYDVQDRLIKKIYHDGTSKEYAYADGLLSQEKGAKNQITGYSYDDNNNLIEIDYPNMADVEITYNVIDQPVQVIDGIGTHQLDYDTMGRLTEVDGPWVNDTVQYSYDALSRQNALGLNGTALQAYSYDALDRLSTLTSAAGTFNYSYVGNTDMLAQLTNPNGTKSEYSYDALERLTQVANKTSGNANLSTFSYGFDSALNPQRDVRISLEKTIGANPTQRVDYGYDTVNQLTGEVLSQGGTPLQSKSFAYDAMGNRTTAGSVTASDTVSSTYTTNRLNQITALNSSWGGGANTLASALQYDLSGNLTKWTSTGTGSATSAHTEYIYDDLDRLTSVIRKNPTSSANESKTEFQYDGFSRLRVSKEYTWDGTAWVLVNNGEKHRIYDGMDVVQERDENNAVLATYTRDGNIGGILSKRDDNGDDYFFHYDGSGNVIGLTDENETSVAEYAYDAYGNLLSSSGAQASNNNYRYSTKEHFGNIGLYNFGYRFYSPGLGRWINRDPSEEEGGINLYAFVTNEPVDWVDEYGLAKAKPKPKKIRQGRGTQPHDDAGNGKKGHDKHTKRRAGSNWDKKRGKDNWNPQKEKRPPTQNPGGKKTPAVPVPPMPENAEETTVVGAIITTCVVIYVLVNQAGQIIGVLP